jgi:hypothetical protein
MQAETWGLWARPYIPQVSRNLSSREPPPCLDFYKYGQLYNFAQRPTSFKCNPNYCLVYASWFKQLVLTIKMSNPAKHCSSLYLKSQRLPRLIS